MSRIKHMAGALMIAGALLNIAPIAAAAEPETTEHCFIIDHPVVCLVVCTARNQSVKACVGIDCNDDFPTVCFVVNEVWEIVP